MKQTWRPRGLEESSNLNSSLAGVLEWIQRAGGLLEKDFRLLKAVSEAGQRSEEAMSQGRLREELYLMKQVSFWDSHVQAAQSLGFEGKMLHCDVEVFCEQAKILCHHSLQAAFDLRRDLSQGKAQKLSAPEDLIGLSEELQRSVLPLPSLLDGLLSEIQLREAQYEGARAKTQQLLERWHPWNASVQEWKPHGQELARLTRQLLDQLQRQREALLTFPELFSKSQDQIKDFEEHSPLERGSSERMEFISQVAQASRALKSLAEKVKESFQPMSDEALSGSQYPQGLAALRAELESIHGELQKMEGFGAAFKNNFSLESWPVALTAIEQGAHYLKSEISMATEAGYFDVGLNFETLHQDFAAAQTALRHRVERIIAKLQAWPRELPHEDLSLSVLSSEAWLASVEPWILKLTELLDQGFWQVETQGVLSSLITEWQHRLESLWVRSGLRPSIQNGVPEKPLEELRMSNGFSLDQSDG